jgi:hypothetical protein
MQEAERAARERPAPEYLAPDDALLHAAPPLHPERTVTEIHKLGRAPRSRSAATPPMPRWQQLGPRVPDEFASCYSGAARQAAAEAKLAANAAAEAALLPQRPVSRSVGSMTMARLKSVKGEPEPELPLAKKQAWMRGWIEARGGIEPAATRMYDGRQLREATAAQRLLGVQARRAGSGKAMSEGAAR